jgi:hypothetical protein
MNWWCEMTNGLSKTQTQVLTWLVYLLITFLTICSGYFFLELSQIKQDYVTIEQYRVDEKRSEDSFCRLEEKIESMGIRIGNKLDKIILQQR